MKSKVQISLDLTSIPEALETAEMAVSAGVDWLEVGTPLVIAEGMNGVRALREKYPDTPIVVDLKTMDGGYLEAEMMAEAGATHVVVMGQAAEETIQEVVRAGEKFDLEVMGDNLGMDDPITGARFLAEAGCDYVVHHVPYDLRTVRQRRGQSYPSPLDQLDEIVDAVDVPVQAVGGLSTEEAMAVPEYGAPVVVIGAPLAIEADRFETTSADIEGILSEICDRVHSYGDVSVGGGEIR